MNSAAIGGRTLQAEEPTSAQILRCERVWYVWGALLRRPVRLESRRKEAEDEIRAINSREQTEWGCGGEVGSHCRA